jgi:predicted solute-binding protein
MRLGRISYVNMAPVFYRLEADVEEVEGVPTELSRMLLDGEIDIARSRRSSTRATRSPADPAARVRVSEGAVDSIQLVTRCSSTRCAVWRSRLRARRRWC